MIQTRTIANLTEIYSDKNGGGKSEIYITEAAPTMFPTFTVRRFLQEGQTPADFREATAAERQKLEAAAKAWTRPPQLFIDLWNAVCGVWGQYNEATGYFELNGFTDITYAEAVVIMESPRITSTNCNYLFNGVDIRTNIPPLSGGTLTGSTTPRFEAYNFLTHNSMIEILNLTTKDRYFCVAPASAGTDSIIGNPKRLKKIIGNIDIGFLNSNKCYFHAPLLESVNFQHLRSNLNLYGLPKLNAASVNFLVEHKYRVGSDATAAYTITLHADVYAKLIGDTTNAAAAALTEEELAEWMQLIPLAAEKNITFVAA